MNNENNFGEFLEDDFKRLSTFVYQNFGINLYPNKKVLVNSRLQRRLRALGLSSFKEYCDLVLDKNNDGMEVVQLMDSLSTNKTDFFREPDHFDYLSNILINQLTLLQKKDFSLWSAGCSTGEEPYTLAMMLTDNAVRDPGFNFNILATDISTKALKMAVSAIYDERSLEQIPKKYWNSYLLKSKSDKQKKIRIVPEIRRKVQFYRHNLMDPASPGKSPVDVIFCRNTLIYFDRKTQYKVVSHLLKHLKPEGYLFLGHSESLVNMDLPCQHVFPAVYQNSSFK